MKAFLNFLLASCLVYGATARVSVFSPTETLPGNVQNILRTNNIKLPVNQGNVQQPQVYRYSTQNSRQPGQQINPRPWLQEPQVQPQRPVQPLPQQPWQQPPEPLRPEGLPLPLGPEQLLPQDVRYQQNWQQPLLRSEGRPAQLQQQQLLQQQPQRYQRNWQEVSETTLGQQRQVPVRPVEQLPLLPQVQQQQDYQQTWQQRPQISQPRPQQQPQVQQPLVNQRSLQPPQVQQLQGNQRSLQPRQVQRPQQGYGQTWQQNEQLPLNNQQLWQ